MKKLTLIIITVSVMITSLLLAVSAAEKNYTNVIEFQDTFKAYPIGNGEENAVGFFEYYETDNITLNASKNGFAEILVISGRKDTSVVIQFYIGGSMPYWDYYIQNPSQYEDVGIYTNNGLFYVYGNKNGQIETLTEINGLIGEDYNFANYTTTTLNEGFYVEYPSNEVVTQETTIVGTIVDTINGFINGFGIAFTSAFTAIFMANGHFNELSIFLLCMMGLMLGYGAIRWTTDLFRKETK